MSRQEPPVIILAFANDKENPDQYLRNLGKELVGIRNALKAAEINGLCEIIERSNTDIAQLVDVLQDQRYRDRIAIFHFGGHANSHQLLLEDLQGKAQETHAKSIIDLLKRRNILKLVFLNGCSTEAQARKLTQTGIPVTIGTSQNIQDNIATQLAIRFYQGLGEGITLEQAWGEAEAYITSQLGEEKGYRGFYRETSPSDQIPWRLHTSQGASPTLSWNLPDATNNPLFRLPPIPEKYYLKLPPKPFIHLKHFERKDAAIFFGRGKQIRDLYNKIQGIHPIILYYGQTGVGKSSLLDAGLLPRLEANYIVIYLRRDAHLGLLGTLFQALKTRNKEEELKSIFDFWHSIESDAQKPLIVILDQAEELFTKPSNLNNQEELGQFMQALSDIFDNDEIKIKGKLILAYRKEYHPEFESAVENHQLAYTKLFLTPLSKVGIIEAIEGIEQDERVNQKYQLEIERNDSQSLPEIISEDLLADRNSTLAPVLQIQISIKFFKFLFNGVIIGESQFGQ